MKVMKWLAYEHGVVVIPGSACGAPGKFRVCYANLEGEKFQDACGRLRQGLDQLLENDLGQLHW